MKNGLLRRSCRLLFCLPLVLLGACAVTPVAPADGHRPFSFKTDVLAFANELDWVYTQNPDTGETTFMRVDPEPDYIHHCFVVVRAAKQFFLHARFNPSAAKADEATYRDRIREVFARSPRDTQPDARPVVIPGYADLRSFSAAHMTMIKDEAGGAWHSYIQMGNWRMVFPFTRAHQAEMATQLLSEIKADWPPIVHLVRFPKITINHAVMLYAATESDKEIRFAVYDPNHPERPGELTYDRASRTFIFPATDYFADGRVDVYEVYRGWLY